MLIKRESATPAGERFKVERELGRVPGIGEAIEYEGGALRGRSQERGDHRWRDHRRISPTEADRHRDRPERLSQDRLLPEQGDPMHLEPNHLGCASSGRSARFFALVDETASAATCAAVHPVMEPPESPVLPLRATEAPGRLPGFRRILGPRRSGPTLSERDFGRRRGRIPWRAAAWTARVWWPL